MEHIALYRAYNKRHAKRGVLQHTARFFHFLWENLQHCVLFKLLDRKNVHLKVIMLPYTSPTFLKIKRASQRYYTASLS